MNKEIIECITINYMDISDTVCYTLFSIIGGRGGGVLVHHVTSREMFTKISNHMKWFQKVYCPIERFLEI